MKQLTRRFIQQVLVFLILWITKDLQGWGTIKTHCIQQGVVSYNTAKELARILKPLVGRTIYSVQNTKDFAEQIKNIKLLPDKCIISYDVKALFTSVPIEPAIKIIQQHLENDNELQQRTSMSVKHIIMLLEFCSKNTHFIFQGRFYEQTEGAAMG